MKKHIWKRKGMTHPGPETIGDLLKGISAAKIQHFGSLSLLPLLAKNPQRHQSIAPLASLRWESAPQLSLKNDSPFPAIVPMQLGYLEYGIPSQAVCESLILAANGERSISNAASLTPPDANWNLMLPDQLIAMPHMLRRSLWASSGERSIGKLWPQILEFQQILGWEKGSVTPIQKRSCAERIILMRQSFILEPQQIGYILYWNGKAIAVELGPTPAWWAEWFPPLCDYSIAPLTFGTDFVLPKLKPRPRQILSKELQAREAQAQTRLLLQKAQRLLMHLSVESLQYQWRFQTEALHLLDIQDASMIGQAVLSEGQCAYLSLFDPESQQL